MSLKRFFILSVLSCFVVSMFSCNEVEEETNVKFEWNYVKRKMQIDGTDTSWVVDISEKYIVDEYWIAKEGNTMKVTGYTTSNDSIVIDFANYQPTSGDDPENTITVGEYGVNTNHQYNLVFYRETFPLLAISGYANISYINSRVDINFFSPLANGFALENGIAENLDVYLEKDTTTTAITIQE